MAVTTKFTKPTGDATVVDVTFTSDSPTLTHQRSVNAVFDSDGKYDAADTKVRVAEVALGVENKIAMGVISAPAE